jgi:hypothetical protein
MARIGISLNNFFFSVNSLPWVHVENYQRRSGAVRHGAEHASVRRHLVPVRYVAIAIDYFSKGERYEKPVISFNSHFFYRHIISSNGYHTFRIRNGSQSVSHC